MATLRVKKEEKEVGEREAPSPRPYQSPEDAVAASPSRPCGEALRTRPAAFASRTRGERVSVELSRAGGREGGRASLMGSIQRGPGREGRGRTEEKSEGGGKGSKEEERVEPFVSGMSGGEGVIAGAEGDGRQ